MGRIKRVQETDYLYTDNQEMAPPSLKSCNDRKKSKQRHLMVRQLLPPGKEISCTAYTI
jgi:hypothetical protein